MTLVEYYEQAGDKNIYLFSKNNVSLATYDGRNSIPEKYNEMQIDEIEETRAGVNVYLNMIKL